MYFARNVVAQCVLLYLSHDAHPCYVEATGGAGSIK